MFTCSKCLFDTITKVTSVAEKPLLIDIFSIRETHTLADLSNVAQVSYKHNLANLFAKFKADDSILSSVMKTGNLLHPVRQWVIPE